MDVIGIPTQPQPTQPVVRDGCLSTSGWHQIPCPGYINKERYQHAAKLSDMPPTAESGRISQLLPECSTSICCRIDMYKKQRRSAGSGVRNIFSQVQANAASLSESSLLLPVIIVACERETFYYSQHLQRTALKHPPFHGASTFAATAASPSSMRNINRIYGWLTLGMFPLLMF